MKTITPFMLEIHRKLMSQREVAETTATQYIKYLYSLNNQRPFTNLTWMKNKEFIDQRLKEFSLNTQKTMLACMVSVLSLYKDTGSYKKIYAHWYNEMQAKRDEKADSSEKSEKQAHNWLDWNVVVSHQQRLQDDCHKFENLRSLTPVQYEHLLHYLVISLFTEIPPRRNQDYQFMMILKKYSGKESNDFNYLSIDSQQFVFNKYKTANVHGQQIIDIPNKLMDIINLYLKFYPNKNKSYFLVDYNNKPILAVNAVTRILNRIFGKNVGVSMLRHIYLSDKYNIDEMEEDAYKMGHTVDMQREYLKSDKVEVPEYKPTGK